MYAFAYVLVICNLATRAFLLLFRTVLLLIRVKCEEIGKAVVFDKLSLDKLHIITKCVCVKEKRET